MRQKEQIELAAIVFGSVLLIFFLITKIILPLTGPKKNLKPAPSMKSSVQKTKDIQDLKSSLLAKKIKSSFGKGKPVYSLWEESTRDMELEKDPFSWASTDGAEEKKERGNFKLEGILWEDARPTAIINGDVVAVGDSISGAKVIRIEKDDVILNNGVSDIKLSL